MANSIVSMIHHYLQYHTHAFVFMQIIVWGKTKNNTMIFYVAWRVSVGLNKSCELNFMLVGHTRFSPDHFFGLIKRKYRCTRVSSLTEIAEKSTTYLQNKVYIIGDESTSHPFAIMTGMSSCLLSLNLYHKSPHISIFKLPKIK